MTTQPHRLFVARVPVDESGRPDLHIPADVTYWNELPGMLWHAYGRGHTLTVLKLGELVGGDWGICGVGDHAVMTWLTSHGATVELFYDAWQDAQYRQWLENHGVTTDAEGNPQAPISYSGDDVVGLATDWEIP
jgi:hypothetical protein